MDLYIRTFIYLYILFMCWPFNCVNFQKKATFQNLKFPFSNFLATNGTKYSSNFSFLFCPTLKHFPNSIQNFSYSWESNKSRDSLCFFPPSAIENFSNSPKQTRTKLREFFQDKLTPYLFLGFPLNTPGKFLLVWMLWVVKPLLLCVQCFCG